MTGVSISAAASMEFFFRDAADVAIREYPDRSHLIMDIGDRHPGDINVIRPSRADLRTHDGHQNGNSCARFAAHRTPFYKTVKLATAPVDRIEYTDSDSARFDEVLLPKLRAQTVGTNFTAA